MDNIITFDKEQIEYFTKLCQRLYNKYFCYVDLEELTSTCLFKFFKSQVYYDSSKSRLTTFMYNLIQNELSNLNSKHKRLLPLDTEMLLEVTPFYDSNHEVDLKISLNQFVLETKTLGVPVSYKQLEKNLFQDAPCPYIKVFLWQRYKETMGVSNRIN